MGAHRAETGQGDGRADAADRPCAEPERVLALAALLDLRKAQPLAFPQAPTALVEVP